MKEKQISHSIKLNKLQFKTNKSIHIKKKTHLKKVNELNLKSKNMGKYRTSTSYASLT